MFNKTRKGNPLPFSGKGKQANVDEGDVKHDDIEHDKKWTGNGPVPKTITMRLNIHRAEKLAAADMTGTSDPLVKIYWHHKKVYTTAVKKLTLNPTWEESYDITIDYETSMQYGQIRFEVYDKDTFGKDDFLGRVAIRLYQILDRYGNSTYCLRTPIDTKKYKLTKRPKGDEDLKVRGFLYLSFDLIDSFDNEDSLPKIVENINDDIDNDKLEAKDYLHTLSWIAATGEEKLADKLAHQAVDERVEVKGKDSEEASVVRDQIGSQYKKCGKYEVAFNYHDEALLSRLRKFDDLGVADSNHNLACLAATKGEVRKAEKMFLKALDLRERLLGKHSLKVASTLNQLSILYKNWGRLEEAEEIATECYEIVSDAHGKLSLSACNVLATLATILRKRGKYEMAFEMFVDILSVRDCAFGPYHPATAVALAQLATSYRVRAKHDFNFHDEGLMLAKNALRRALTIKEHLYGKNSLKLATTLINFAKLYSDTHDYKRAEPVMKRAYEIRKDVLGEKHPDSIVTKSELASVISHRGRFEEAKEMLLQCLDGIVTVCGRDNPKTDKVFRNYVFTATEEGVHELELHFGNRKVEIEELPPYRYIWERCVDAIKALCVTCTNKIIENINKHRTKKVDVEDDDDDGGGSDDSSSGEDHGEKEEIEEESKNDDGNNANKNNTSKYVTEIEDKNNQSTVEGPSKPNRKRTMMFDRPIVKQDD